MWDIPLDWLKSYFTNRRQYVHVNNNVNSTLPNVTCGVPQGSVLHYTSSNLHIRRWH